MDSSTDKADASQEFEALLEFIRLNRGFDFTGYKRASLMRRFRRRLTAVKANTFGEYQDYVEVHPEEFGLLFNTILVNVTSFFRDPDAWDYLAREVVPALVASKRPDEPVRVWSAGCASGEEPFTIAMLLAEAMGKDACVSRAKIYATDVDEEALAQARSGAYSQQAVQEVPEELRQKFFLGSSGHHVFDKDLRRAVIFGRHDLMYDAPISRLDLLVCRNTLMYFNSESQRRILARFHFALNDQGYLFLGKAETLLSSTHLFTPVNAKYRMFSKVAHATGRDRLLAMAQAGDTDAGAVLAKGLRLREGAFETTPTAQVVVEATGNLVLANQEACAMFGLSPKDLGRAFRDMELSYRPVELRSAIEQAYSERRAMRFSHVERPFPDGSTQYLDIQLVPLFDNGGTPLGVSIAFADVTRLRQLELELQRVTQELETTNEELQSANEELETTNEELQSTNEEIEAANTELRVRTSELDEAVSFLRSVLSSINTGLAVLDHGMAVLHWNAGAEDMWGLREDEVRGKHFLALDMGLPVQELKDRINLVLADQSSREEALLSAVNRRGKPFQCYLTITPLVSRQEANQGAVLLMEPPHEATNGKP